MEVRVTAPPCRRALLCSFRTLPSHQCRIRCPSCRQSCRCRRDPSDPSTTPLSALARLTVIHWIHTVLHACTHACMYSCMYSCMHALMHACSLGRGISARCAYLVPRAVCPISIFFLIPELVRVAEFLRRLIVSECCLESSRSVETHAPCSRHQIRLVASICFEQQGGHRERRSGPPSAAAVLPPVRLVDRSTISARSSKLANNVIR